MCVLNKYSNSRYMINIYIHFQTILFVLLASIEQFIDSVINMIPSEHFGYILNIIHDI